LQTFFEYPERAERHRKAAVKYKVIIRELEEALATVISHNGTSRSLRGIHIDEIDVNRDLATA
jgi:hypothetical protein